MAHDKAHKKTKNWWSRMLTRLHVPRPHLPGFRLSGSLAGNAVVNGAKKEGSFDLSIEAPSLSEYLRTGRAHVSGTATVEGLADRALLHGETWLSLRHRRLRYELSFRAQNGHLMTFRGEKKVPLLHPLAALRHLPGHIQDDQGHLSEAKLNLQARDLPGLLRSLRRLRPEPVQH